MSNRLEVIRETSTLEFHTSRLNLKDISVKSDGHSTTFYPSSQSSDPDSERTTLKFDNTFPTGSNIKLNVSFDASLTQDMMGYYYSEFKHNGKPGHYSITQFEVGIFQLI